MNPESFAPKFVTPAGREYRLSMFLSTGSGNRVSSLGWMASAACAARLGLPWTAGPGTYQVVLVCVMGDPRADWNARACVGRTYPGDVAAGFWVASWRTHPNRPLHPKLPLDDFEDAT